MRRARRPFARLAVAAALTLTLTDLTLTALSLIGFAAPPDVFAPDAEAPSV